MLSRSALAHIYDKAKAKTTSPSIGSAKRGPLVLHRARNARIRFKPQIDFFCPLQLRGRRPTRQSRSASGLSSTPSTTPMPRSPVQPLRSPRSPCRRPQVRMIRILGSRRCSGIDGWPRQGRPARMRPRRQRSLLRSNSPLRIRKRSTQRILRMMRDMMPAPAPAVRAAVSAGHPVGVRRPNAASCADRASCAVRDPQLARPAAPSGTSQVAGTCATGGMVRAVAGACPRVQSSRQRPR